MKIQFIYTLALVFSIVSGSFGQGKKDVKKYKIKSITEFVSSVENGKEANYKAYYIAFNKDGEVLEETEFSSNGAVKKKSTTKFDGNENKTEETFYQKKNGKTEPEAATTINLKTVYRYNAHNDKTEAEEIDLNTGKTLKKHIYKYNNQGERNIEETYDADNKLTKKELFTYDGKGLKTEKKAYSANNVLEMTKKYVYEFY
jgi:hypothetical protein